MREAGAVPATIAILGGQITVGPDGMVYVTGMTTSADFPVTSNAFSKKLGGANNKGDVFNQDAFVAKINPAALPRTYDTGTRLYRRYTAPDFIVASGVRGALPHGKASTKVINSGELVTIDFGCVCNGYFSDETITVVVGEPDKRQMEVYSVVKVAHDRALAAVRPGMSLKSLDGLARDYINDMGFGSYFGHGLGHGVGLEVHEQPVVSFRSDGIVDEGMVFTIEPGIYIPGWGGVRIEDTVVVTADGCRVLTRVPKELQVIA